MPIKGDGPDFFSISFVARRFNIHPQTLRMYEREGLLRPARSRGNSRLYDQETLRQLDVILTLTRDLGVNLAGVQVILNMRERMKTMSDDVDRLFDLVRSEMHHRKHEVGRSQALVRVVSTALVKRDG